MITRERTRVNLRSGLTNFRAGSKTPHRLVARSASIRPKDYKAERDNLYQLIYELDEHFKDDAGSTVWESTNLKKKLIKAMSRDLALNGLASNAISSS